jgi:hypothetical protein
MERQLKTALPEQPAESSAAGRSSSYAETQVFTGLDKISSVVERELARSSSSASSTSAPSAYAAPPSPVAPPVPASSSAAVATEEDDAESLESYLGKFMERMVGSKPGSAHGSTAGGNAGTATVPVAPTEPESVKITVPRELLPAPERREQMAALRELANQNAHNAIVLHACRGLKVEARVKFVAAMATSLFSCGLAAVALLEGSYLAQIGSAVTGAAGLMLACRFFRLCREHQLRSAEFQE